MWHGKPRRKQDQIGTVSYLNVAGVFCITVRVGRMRYLATNILDEWSSFIFGYAENNYRTRLIDFFDIFIFRA